MHVTTVETPPLGDRSYLVHDGEIGVVVDVQRDLDRMEAEIQAAGVRVTHVLETHIHNDYVSGGLELSRRTGAEYVVAAGDEVSFGRRAIADGDTWTTGQLQLTALATPGHTLHHMSYVVEDAASGKAVVFSGGNLLYGSVGRTDLVDPAMTDELTRQQFRSARMLGERLRAETDVYPTHGFGSFCSSGPATVKAVSTIGEQQKENNALTTDDEDTFVRDLVAGLAAYPRYYAHMGALNRQGAGPVQLEAPVPLDPAELQSRLEEGRWVIDLRDRRAFAARHARGAVSFELGDNFTTYFGWVIPWDEPVVLLGDSPDQVAEAQRDLSRIGVEGTRLAGAATIDSIESWTQPGATSSYPAVSWETLWQEITAGDPTTVIVDVRREDEFASGHLEGAVNVPLHDLLACLGQVPEGTLWVHCGSGYRAAIAASILERAGHEVVHVDDDWDRAVEVGLPVVAGQQVDP